MAKHQVRNDVDKGEEEQPHDVNEVPVPGRELEAEMLLGRHAARHQTNEADRKEDRSDDDVRTMETGRHEEG